MDESLLICKRPYPYPSRECGRQITLALTWQSDTTAAGARRTRCVCGSQPAEQEFSAWEAEAAATKSTLPDLSWCVQGVTASLSCSRNQRCWDALCRCPSAPRQGQPACSQHCWSQRNADLVFVPSGWVGGLAVKKQHAYWCKWGLRSRTLHQESNLRDYNFLKWGLTDKKVKKHCPNKIVLSETACTNYICWKTSLDYSSSHCTRCTGCVI